MPASAQQLATDATQRPETDVSCALHRLRGALCAGVAALALMGSPAQAKEASPWAQGLTGPGTDVWGPTTGG